MSPFAVYMLFGRPTMSLARPSGNAMHHKRKGPKSTRSGCLLCKPHKRQGVMRVVKVKGWTGRHALRRPCAVSAH